MGDVFEELHQTYRTSYGTVLPSVTAVIGSNLGWGTDVLAKWHLKMARQNVDPEAVKVRAGYVGTVAHALIQRHVVGELGAKGVVPELDQDQWAPAVWRASEVAFGAFLDWLDTTNYAPTWSELQLASDLHMFGGTLDLGCLTPEGKDVFVDFKTSNSIKASHVVQVSAYWELYRQEFGHAPWEVQVLWLGKDARIFQTVGVHGDQLEAGWRAFSALLEVDSVRRVWDQGASDTWWLGMTG